MNKEHCLFIYWKTRHQYRLIKLFLVFLIFYISKDSEVTYQVSAVWFSLSIFIIVNNIFCQLNTLLMFLRTVSSSSWRLSLNKSLAPRLILFHLRRKSPGLPLKLSLGLIPLVLTHWHHLKLFPSFCLSSVSLKVSTLYSHLSSTFGGKM